MFADGHTHTNPVSGMGMKNVAPRFKSVGGWFLAIVSLPPSHYGLPMNFEGFVKSVELLIKECREAQSYGLKVKCIAGFHPAEFDKLVTRYGYKLDQALDLANRVLDYIAKLCRDGVLDGIGEVGRPHYKVEPIYVVASELAMERALELAKDLGVVVHLHLEQGGKVTAIDVAKRIERIGLDKRRVVLHHADLSTAKAAIDLGLELTVVGKLPLLREAFHRLPPQFMVESDHIDDPKRPGVAAYPWEIVENQIKLLNEGVVSEEYLQKINIDKIVEVYGVEPP